MPRSRKPGHSPVEWSPSRRRDVRDALDDGLAHGQFHPEEQSLAEGIVRTLKTSSSQLTRDQAETAARLLAKLVERNP